MLTTRQLYLNVCYGEYASPLSALVEVCKLFFLALLLYVDWSGPAEQQMVAMMRVGINWWWVLEGMQQSTHGTLSLLFFAMCCAAVIAGILERHRYLRDILILWLTAQNGTAIVRAAWTAVMTAKHNVVYQSELEHQGEVSYTAQELYDGEFVQTELARLLPRDIVAYLRGFVVDGREAVLDVMIDSSVWGVMHASMIVTIDGDLPCAKVRCHNSRHVFYQTQFKTLGRADTLNGPVREKGRLMRWSGVIFPKPGVRVRISKRFPEIRVVRVRGRLRKLDKELIRLLRPVVGKKGKK